MLLVSSIPCDKQGEGKVRAMEKIELVTRSILQVVLAATLLFLGVRTLTGCRYLASAEGKAKIVESLKTAYAEGGRTAVSNKIEKLVETGDLSRKQAAKLHEIAQGVYDHVVEKLEAELNAASAEAAK